MVVSKKECASSGSALLQKLITFPACHLSFSVFLSLGLKMLMRMGDRYRRLRSQTRGRKIATWLVSSGAQYIIPHVVFFAVSAGALVIGSNVGWLSKALQKCSFLTFQLLMYKLCCIVLPGRICFSVFPAASAIFGGTPYPPDTFGQRYSPAFKRTAFTRVPLLSTASITTPLHCITNNAELLRRYNKRYRFINTLCQWTSSYSREYSHSISPIRRSGSGPVGQQTISGVLFKDVNCTLSLPWVCSAPKNVFSAGVRSFAVTMSENVINSMFSTFCGRRDHFE